MTAYRVVGVRGLMAREETVLLVRPVFTAVQVVPLSLERKTPSYHVPAYRIVGALGSMARELTSRGAGAVFTAVQVAPLSVER
jgi:hypothetical protein